MTNPLKSPTNPEIPEVGGYDRGYLLLPENMPSGGDGVAAIPEVLRQTEETSNTAGGRIRSALGRLSTRAYPLLGAVHTTTVFGGHEGGMSEKLFFSCGSGLIYAMETVSMLKGTRSRWWACKYPGLLALDGVLAAAGQLSRPEATQAIAWAVGMFAVQRGTFKSTRSKKV
jgi:hypothetical protein